MKKILKTLLILFCLASCFTLCLTACDEFTQDDIDNAVNAATSPLNERITALEAEKTALEAEKTALEAEKTALEAENAALEAEKTALEAEKTALATEKTELLADIEEIEAEITALETEKAALEAAVADLSQEKASLTTDKAALEASIASKNNEIATLNSSISALGTEKANLTARVNELEASITAKDTEIATLQAEKQILTDRVGELEKENAELKECLAGNHAFEFSYKWADDYSDCAAAQVCQRTHCGFENKFTVTSITVSGTALTATFDGAEATTIDITTIENQDYIVTIGENNNSTYVIYNKAGLDAWGTAASSDVSTNLTLACDIEYNASWSKFGITYDGIIDGNGYAIVGLNCTDAEQASFIYELGSSGVIKHLGIVEGSFYNVSSSSSDGSSAFATMNNGIIMGCYNTCSCTSSGESDDFGSAAGITFKNKPTGKIIACYNAGTIAAGGSYGSGISGANDGVISGCYNTGAVSGKGASYGYIASAITSSNRSTITDCYYTQPSDGYKNSINYSCTATNITQITGSDWTDAMNAMNAAIEAYNADEANTVKCNYRYAINTDADTKSEQPLIIVEVEAN